MAYPTAVNGQITDAVSQAGVQVLGDAPALALGTLYQTMAQATALALQNAVASQQSLGAVNQAATVAAIALFTRP